jgi:hypothetical protein
MNEEILQLSEKLLHFNETFLKTYIESREKGSTHDFQEDIKPFVNDVKKINLDWNKKTKEWLAKKDFKHLHMRQIDTTSDHIDQISIQCFFPETSRSRFLNAQRTVEYFLLELIKELKK